MKKNKSSPGPTVQSAIQRRLRWVRRGLVGCLIVLTVIYVWIFAVSSALGWMQNAQAGENWPAYFYGYGQMMLFAAVLLTAGAVLCLLKKNWASIGVATAGILPAMTILQKVVLYAEDAGFFSELMQKPVYALYRDRLLPLLAMYGVLVVLALLQHWSPEAISARAEKKAEENKPAPKIIP